MPGDTSSLTIPNDTAYLPVVGAYVKAIAAHLGFDEADLGDIRLAVDEACTHVIQTAFEPGEEQTLTISCRQFPSGLRVTIADKGMPFDPGSIQEYDVGGGPDQELSGLPFYLIQQAMDEVRFVNQGCEGKELQLTKYLKVPGVETYFPHEDLRPYDTTVEPAPPAKYSYRLMQPADAIEIARCVYKTYGYTYPGEHIYYPERVVSMVQSGELLSAVAVTESGEVVGHCALSGHPGDRVMEVGQAVVAPAHRKRGVMKELVDLLMGEARRQGLTGLSVNSVTVHPFSQRATHRYGFRESALLLAYGPQKAHFKEIMGQELPQRETVITSYQSLGTDYRSRVYPPARHRSIIARIYDNLGLDRELAPPDVPPPSYEHGDPCPYALSTHIKSEMRTALIEVSDYGPGIEDEVKNKLRDLCYERIAVVYLDLPLSAPQTALACQHFEELGFFFAGVLPGPAEEEMKVGDRLGLSKGSDRLGLSKGSDRLGLSKGGDRLCLQYLNGSHIDYDLLHIYSDFGQELAGYVREHDPLA